jgi:hypothetical protein
MAFACVTPTYSFSADNVAIAISHGAFGGHIGVAFHSNGAGPQLLHLRFHQDLDVEAFPPTRPCWIATVVQLPIPASKHLVGIVRYVAKNLPRINFGVDFIAARGSFSATGVYNPPPGSNGLTCATFVTEIFRAAALTLIREQSWQPHPDNYQWSAEVIDELRRRGASQGHLMAVALSFRGLRVRPEEVGAAADSPVGLRPLDFASARAGAPAVQGILNSCCPPRKTMVGAVAKAIRVLWPKRH